ncbi:helix-turn-helix domain-containing protein [Enterococcus hirae]|nr:helix-turn-helix domain-containing protein [Enterococcus hirae]EMF0076382.1 helix-turn-helix domain-containing protein [Enterococcus hirae]
MTGKELKAMRLKTGLSQREVANALSISHSS